MTNIDPSAIDRLLSRGLRDRAEAVGDEHRFQREVVAAATARPQQWGWIAWRSVLGRRGELVVVAALVGAALAATAIGGAFLLRQAAGPHNGPILVGSEGTSWWLDPTSGEVISAGLPRLPDKVEDAAWSRDGSRLAIVVEGDLELLDLATGARTVLATCHDIAWVCELDGERPGSIDWSPDGQSIGVARPRRLLRIDVDSGAITPIIDPSRGGGVEKLSWSPDGRWIAFESVADPGDAVARWVEVVRPDGLDRHRVSPPSVPGSIGASQPFWSPDGKQLVYLTSDPWIERPDMSIRGWPLKATVLEVADGKAAGSPVKDVDLGTFYCVGFCPTFALAPDGASVIVDTGDGLVLAPLDGTAQVKLAPDARVLAWRPVP